MEEVKEFENSVFSADNNNGFISIPYCNYVSGNIVFNDYQFLDNLEETNQKITLSLGFKIYQPFKF